MENYSGVKIFAGKTNGQTKPDKNLERYESGTKSVKKMVKYRTPRIQIGY